MEYDTSPLISKDQLIEILPHFEGAGELVSISDELTILYGTARPFVTTEGAFVVFCDYDVKEVFGLGTNIVAVENDTLLQVGDFLVVKGMANEKDKNKRHIYPLGGGDGVLIARLKQNIG